MCQLFGDKTEEIINELNEVLAAEFFISQAEVLLLNFSGVALLY